MEKNNKAILVISNMTPSRIFLSRICVKLGHKSYQASNIEAAIKTVQRKDIHLIFMDLRKYKNESQTMIKRIRDMINGDMPIIAIGGNEEYNSNKTISFDYIMKTPIEPKFIKKILLKFIDI